VALVGTARRWAMPKVGEEGPKKREKNKKGRELPKRKGNQK